MITYLSITVAGPLTFCGCREWDEFTGGEWVHRSDPCWRHADGVSR